MSSPPDPRPDRPGLEAALLAQSAWVRRLARGLAGARAEDLAQEAWVAALSARPGVDRSLRGWLATVLRRAARDERRGEAGRAARERAAAVPEAARGGPGDVIARVGSHRMLVERVLALEEPVRTVVCLRYFEELPAARIARRLGLPVGTVKDRIARGLELLRRDLRRDHGGDDGAWLAALAPLLRRPIGAGALPFASPLSHLPIGVVAMNLKLVALVVLVPAVAALVLWRARPVEPAPRPDPVLARVEAAGLPDVGRAPERTEDPAPAAPSERQPVAVSRGAAAEPAAAAVPAPPHRGRVIDVVGRPLANVGVRRERGSEGARTSGADGRFELPRAEGGGRIVVDDRRFVTVLAAHATEREAQVVAAPRLDLGGTVVDAAGVPVAEARLVVTMPADLRGRIGANLDTSEDLAWTGRADAEGGFALEAVPFVEGALLRVASEGYEPLEEPLPATSRADLVLVLTASPGIETLEGVVVDPAGAPVEGAEVALGLDVVRTDAQGRFAFDLQELELTQRMQARLAFSPDALLAVHPDYLPASYEAPRDAAGAPRWSSPVVLRLGADPLEIHGVVVDEAGAPVPGIEVWVGDPTLFGGIRAEGRSGSRLATVEQRLSGREETWHAVTTDDDGRFALVGLVDREYRVEAMDPGTLLRAVLPRVRAGEDDLEVVLPTSEVYPVLRGRVVDVAGTPVPGLRVAPQCDALRLRFRGEVVQTHHGGAEPVATDEEGRFELEDVPKDLVYLRLDGPDTLPLEWGRHVEGGLAKLAGEDPEEVRIVVHRRAHFRIELADAGEADALAVLDPEGERLEISEFRGSSRGEGWRQAIVDGRSNTLAVSDRAATLVLLKEEAEVRRVPLHLVPGGEVAVVRP